ncbi:hypothetical protein [Streptomyces lutosisoli]|uniref:Transposase n=1 Tax=Streptomyces lutosisoli TaxID=2665721 RepID=A0ABW2W267_9ACTN
MARGNRTPGPPDQRSPYADSWSIADHMHTELVTDALAAAERCRGNLAGAVIHTDHGAQGGFN